VKLHPDIPLGRWDWPAGVEAHSYSNRDPARPSPRPESALDLHSGVHGLEGVRERYEESVALSIHLDAAALVDT
jgi:hypothetical protein